MNIVLGKSKHGKKWHSIPNDWWADKTTRTECCYRELTIDETLCFPWGDDEMPPPNELCGRLHRWFSRLLFKLKGAGFKPE